MNRSERNFSEEDVTMLRGLLRQLTSEAFAESGTVLGDHYTQQRDALECIITKVEANVPK